MSISIQDIPQFSNFNDGTTRLVYILRWHGQEGLTFTDLGKYLLGEGRTEIAYKKYGENHAKLAYLLGLAQILKKTPKIVVIAKEGEKLLSMNEAEQETFLAKQIANTKLVRFLYSKTKYGSMNLLESLHNLGLSPSTAQRRAPNIRFLIKKMAECGISESKQIISALD